MVTPQVFLEKMLRELHWEHPVICAVKVIARTCVWWPKMDEEMVRGMKSCSVCQNVWDYPPNAPFILWTTRPFWHVHIDFCQKGCDYLLVMLYSHSKWIEVQPLTLISTEKTINELLEEVVSYNEPQFMSNAYEFAEFMHKKWYQTHFNSSLSPTIKWSV